MAINIAAKDDRIRKLEHEIGLRDGLNQRRGPQLTDSDM